MKIKNYIKITILMLFLSIFLGSCKDSFLDIVPKKRLVAETTEDYDLLINNSGFYYSSTGGLQVPRWMGDEIAVDAHDITDNHLQAQLLFRWEDVIYSNPNDIVWDLSRGLGSIYTYNKIINEVMDSKEGTEAEKKSILAEAKASRAFEHFMFINFYAKPYVASTASTDPGFPIITSTDVTANNFTRASVQEVYDFIIEELTTAIDDLPLERPYYTRMTKPAARGLLGKVYMFMGKFDEALPLLNAAFTDLATSTNPPHLYDYNVEFADEGSFLPIDYTYNTGPRGPGNERYDFTESILARIYYSGIYDGNSAGRNGLVLSPEAAALYDTADFRLNFYDDTYEGYTGYYNNGMNPNGLLRKFGIQYTRYGLELSELYLLRAECKARKDDLTGAVADVEALRAKRMSANVAVPVDIKSDKIKLIKFIFEERIREWATEGYRWFDMRRLSVDPNAELAATVGDIHKIYDYVDGSTVVTETFTLDMPDRLTLRIPQSYIDENPGMEQNP